MAKKSIVVRDQKRQRMILQYAAEDGSVVLVMAGEQLSEYQALEAMLLPSANNMADSIAIWAFGSLANYSVYANQFVANLGLSHTHIGSDASGFLPDTTSSSSDMVTLGLDVLQNPILAQITSEAHATIPVAGIVNNVNWLLGQDGIFGIKTGNSDQAGGVYLFAAHDQLSASHSLTIVGALEGLPTLQIALNDAVPLLNSVKANFTDSTVVQAGQVVGYYDTPWGSTASAIANNALTTIVWDGQTPQPMLTLKPLRTPQFSGATVGTISLGLDSSGVSTPVTLSSNLSKPPLYWHIFRHKL